MDPYGGFEPHVGQIYALRTFRVGPGGRLYPLFSTIPWVDGENTARCLRSPAEPQDGSPAGTTAGTSAGTPGVPGHEGTGHPSGHVAPGPDCACGFYAYGSEAAAGEYPYARHVRAVVSCWGRIIAGTRGVRAQFCRIEALWLSAAVPDEVVAQVRACYPSVAIYRAPELLLAEHPLTPLDCYELRPASRWSRPGPVLPVAAAVAVVLGVLPTGWLGGDGGAELVWGACGLLFLTLAACFGRRASADLGRQRRRLWCLAVGLWALAPFAGFLGLVLIRFPLMEFAGLVLLRRVRMHRAANRFPADIG